MAAVGVLPAHHKHHFARLVVASKNHFEGCPRSPIQSSMNDTAFEPK
jgi:hypothetical protein